MAQAASIDMARSGRIVARTYHTDADPSLSPGRRCCSASASRSIDRCGRNCLVLACAVNVGAGRNSPKSARVGCDLLRHVSLRRHDDRAPFLFDRILVQRAGPTLAVLVFPLAFVTIEFLRSPVMATRGLDRVPNAACCH
jgi:hypothetical protein